MASWNRQRCADVRQADGQTDTRHVVTQLPVCLCLISTVLSLTELPSVCLSVRLSVPPVASANPAQLGSAPARLPPRPRPGPGPSRVKLHLHGGGKKGKKKRGNQEKRERKRYSQSSTRPLRCSLSLSATLSLCRSTRAAPSCCRCALTSSGTHGTQALPVAPFKIKPPTSGQTLIKARVCGQTWR